METLKKQPIRHLRKPADIIKLKPEKNPYSTKIFEYKDYIWFDGKEEAAGFADFAKGPLVVDLGCGSGNFMRQYALHAPEKNFVGFELRFKRLVLGAKKYKKDGHTNIRLIRDMAEQVDHWFEPESIELIHVNFPDPWPKKRHHKNRLIQPSFLDSLHRLLETGGRFVFKTDHSEYFETSLEILTQDNRFEVKNLTRDLHNTEIFNFYTEFELLFKSQGLPVNYVELQKK